MAWRVAKSLDKLLVQINALAPKRSKASDGSIGDEDHANRSSDHNPWCSGVVTARDFTHDPAHGADMNTIAEALRRSKDSRIKYVIWNRRIFSRTTSPWTWRSYSGSNPHDKHMHVSVECNASKDDTRDWTIGPRPKPRFRLVAKKVIEKVVAGRKRMETLRARLRKQGFTVTKKRMR